MKRVYLAGPDVFLPDAPGWAMRKQRICREYGLHGVSPLDAFVPEPAGWAALTEAERIARRNEAHIRACAAVIADLTPFRGPSADSGTVYEVGFARGLGLPVFAYTIATADFAARSRHAAADGMAIEDFGLTDNLMIDCAVRESGALVQAPGVGLLDAFTRCVALAARALAA